MTYWSRSFQGLAESLSEVRHFTASVLGNRPGVDLVVLAASELAGNAVQHTASGLPGGQFVVHVAVYADKWQIRVDDEGGDNEPVLKEPSGDADGDLPETGRGLALVAAVARDWGVLGDHYARAVWADIPYETAADGQARGGAKTGGTLRELEAALDAVEDGDPSAARVILPVQSTDSPVERPQTPPADPDGSGARPDPGADEVPSGSGDPFVRGPEKDHGWELPSRERLRAAGVTELEAMLIEMAYTETVGRC